MSNKRTVEADDAPVWVGRTGYPWNSKPGREWMWRCRRVNDCSRWHYDVDDMGFASSHAEAVRLGLAHAAIPHPDEPTAAHGPGVETAAPVAAEEGQ